MYIKTSLWSTSSFQRTAMPWRWRENEPSFMKAEVVSLGGEFTWHIYGWQTEQTKGGFHNTSGALQCSALFRIFQHGVFAIQSAHDSDAGSSSNPAARSCHGNGHIILDPYLWVRQIKCRRAKRCFFLTAAGANCNCAFRSLSLTCPGAYITNGPFPVALCGPWFHYFFPPYEAEYRCPKPSPSAFGIREIRDIPVPPVHERL